MHLRKQRPKKHRTAYPASPEGSLASDLEAGNSGRPEGLPPDLTPPRTRVPIPQPRPEYGRRCGRPAHMPICARGRGLPEMLGELEALALVVGLEVAAVEHFRLLSQSLVDEPADDLTILQYERDVQAANFQHGLGADRRSVGNAATWVEEASIVDAVFAHHRVEGGHFRGQMAWNDNGFLGC